MVFGFEIASASTQQTIRYGERVSYAKVAVQSVKCPTTSYNIQRGSAGAVGTYLLVFPLVLIERLHDSFRFGKQRKDNGSRQLM